MQNEVPLTLTTLHNDPEQMASLRAMVDSFTWSGHTTQDSRNRNNALLEQDKT